MSNINQQTALLIDGLKTVEVQFYDNHTNNYGGKPYSYKTLEKLEVGDLCVVNASGRNKVVRVMTVNTFPNIEKATNWIIDKVDLSKHQRILEVEETLKNKLKAIQYCSFRKQAIQALVDNSGISVEELNELTSQASKILLEEKA